LRADGSKGEFVELVLSEAKDLEQSLPCDGWALDMATHVKGGRVSSSGVSLATMQGTWRSGRKAWCWSRAQAWSPPLFSFLWEPLGADGSPVSSTG